MGANLCTPVLIAVRVHGCYQVQIVRVVFGCRNYCVNSSTEKPVQWSNQTKSIAKNSFLSLPLSVSLYISVQSYLPPSIPFSPSISIPLSSSSVLSPPFTLSLTLFLLSPCLHSFLSLYLHPSQFLLRPISPIHPLSLPVSPISLPPFLSSWVLVVYSCC